MPPDHSGSGPREPALIIGEEIVVRGGRIALILAATVRDVAREVAELALVVDGARRGTRPLTELEAEVSDDSS